MVGTVEVSYSADRSIAWSNNMEGDLAVCIKSRGKIFIFLFIKYSHLYL